MSLIISMKYDRSGFDDQDKIWLDLLGNRLPIRLQLEDFSHRKIERHDNYSIKQGMAGMISKEKVKEIIDFLQDYYNSTED